MSKRGNTYTMLATVNGYDLTQAEWVILTVKPINRPSIEFDKAHMNLAYGDGKTTIAYKLTEEQSVSMDTTQMSIDVNWMLNGNRGGTRIKTIPIDRTLLARVIGGGENTPDPTAAEPDVAELSAEEARVVNAVSPHVTTERIIGSNHVTVTITDIDGEHVFLIYDGEDGVGIASVTLNDDYTLTITYTDGNGYTTSSIRGAQGAQGAPGQDGVSPEITVTDMTGGHRLTITDAEHPSGQTVDVMDGTNGTNGTDGTDAYVYIRYAATEPTSDSDMKTTPDAWIGIYSGDAATAPTHYTDYVWYKIKGETGAAGVVQDVQVNGTSVVTSGVANIPIGQESGSPGVVKPRYGLYCNPNTGTLDTSKATNANIKNGAGDYAPIVPSNQHISAFYGIARAAGDTTQKDSSNAVGQYTESAKSAISEMLNGSVSVSGSTPSITAKAGIRYVCGEISTLALTLPASGIVDVVFESGSTATVLTITPPSGVTAVRWADGWDGTCEANTTYELNILNGELGVKAAWT